MAKDYWLPTEQAKLKSWLNNFDLKLPNYATVLGIDAATLTFVSKAKNYAIYLIDMENVLRSDLAEWTKHKQAVLKGKKGTEISALPEITPINDPPPTVEQPIFAYLTKLVNTIKNHASYTESIGVDLQIIGTEITMPPADVKPVISAKVIGNTVTVYWKKGVFSALDIYVDRGLGRGFEFLNKDLRPHFTENINLPAGSAPQTWVYRAQYRYNDLPYGNFSDPVSVVVSLAL